MSERKNILLLGAHGKVLAISPGPRFLSGYRKPQDEFSEHRKLVWYT